MTRADALRLYNLDLHKVRWPRDLQDASRQARYRYGLDMPDVVKIYTAHRRRCEGRGSPAECDSALSATNREGADVERNNPNRERQGGVGDVPASLDRRT